MGLDEIVGAIRSDKKCSDYYIGGFERSNTSVRMYAAVAAVSSHVSDGVLYDLMKDDRLARKASLMRGVMAKEMAYIQGLSPTLWRMLGGAVGVDSHVLQSASIKAAMVQVVFFETRALSHAAGYPWRLCQGDPIANLEALAEAPAGRRKSDRVSAQWCVPEEGWEPGDEGGRGGEGWGEGGREGGGG